jgi:energy-coupling factor transport system ATP-binding protein
VTLCGRRTDQSPVSELAADGGLVLQNPLHQLLASSVGEELDLGLRGLDRAAADARVAETLAALDLAPLRERHPLALSEGQRRRVALAAALVRRPRVLILDEPTLGQDEQGRAALGRIVWQLAGAQAAVLAISHDVEFVTDFCDRALLLAQGRLVADEPLDLALVEPDRFAAAGLPLGEVPRSAQLLTQRGAPGQARRGEQLVAALRGNHEGCAR